MVRGIEVAGNRLFAKDTLDAVDVDVTQLQMIDRLIDDRRGIESLFVLAKADIANKAIVIELDALTAAQENRAGNARELEVRLIEFHRIGVSNYRPVGFSIHRIVETLFAELRNGVDVNPPRQPKRVSGGIARPQQQGVGDTFARSSRLRNPFKAIARTKICLAAKQCVDNCVPGCSRLGHRSGGRPTRDNGEGTHSGQAPPHDYSEKQNQPPKNKSTPQNTPTANSDYVNPVVLRSLSGRRFWAISTDRTASIEHSVEIRVHHMVDRQFQSGHWARLKGA